MGAAKCENCGAGVEYAPGTDTLVCPYCESKITIKYASLVIEEKEYSGAVSELEDGAVVEEYDAVVCPACGASATPDPEVSYTQCGFCGTDISTGYEKKKSIAVQYLVPFAIEKQTAMENFSKWLSSLAFAPGGVKRGARADAFKGMYTPYWTFDAHIEADYEGRRGDEYTVTKEVENSEGNTEKVEETEIRWTDVKGHLAADFDDLLVAAAKSLPQGIVSGLEPWDLSALTPYNESYFSGFAVQLYDIEMKDAFEKAKLDMISSCEDMAESEIGGDEQDITKMNMDYQDVTYKSLLLPIWISSFRYKGKVYRFLVNGQSGEVQGERPWSVIKIVLFILTLIAIGAAVYFSLQYFK